MVTKVENRNIKYPRIEFRDGKLNFILPLDMDYSEISKKYSKWIDNKKAEIQNALNNSTKLKLNNRSLETTKMKVVNLVNEYSKSYGLVVNRIIFRTLKSKWGSCSKQGNLTFNTILQYLPDKYIEYVVFHEVMHMIARKHSSKFWSLVSHKFQMYIKIERELFSYWFAINNLK